MGSTKELHLSGCNAYKQTGKNRRWGNTQAG